MTKDEILNLIEKITIAKILSFEKHPNADRLLIVKIQTKDETGSLIEKQIVTGANNFEAGNFVPYLAPGHVVPGFLIHKNETITLETRPLRGVMSEGMILAEDEIGTGEDHTGILVFQDATDELIGESILKVLGEAYLEKLWQSDAIIEGLKAVTEEILGEDTLVTMLKNKEKINHYIGFEISGLVHLGTGIMAGLVIRELQKLGIHTKIFLADWHTWMNNKLNGDRDLIRRVALEYFGPAMKISAQIAGADPEKIEFVFGSDLYDKNNRYWQTAIEVSKDLTLSRVMKSTTILGREESDSMNFAFLVYPIMQVADIYEMENHIAHAGTDQRKCHVIAREVANHMTIHPLTNAKGEIMKPIAIHHALVSGLQKPAQWPLPENIDKKELMTSLKMSKSVEGSAIFIHDTPEQIRDAIRKAFCPEREIGYNPVLNWVKSMIFPIIGKFELKRDEKFGGDRTFTTFAELESAYAAGEVFPLDLKDNVAEILIELLAPARDRFASIESQELIETIRSVKKKR